MFKVLAEIITIGDEILIGQVIDTNSAWIAKTLAPLGISIKQITSVSDDKTHIVSALNQAQQRVDIILITGGLGPTKDDITKNTLAEYFGSGLTMHEATLKRIEEIFSKRKLPLLESNKMQAYMPDLCVVLPNLIGTAPGMWFEQNQKVFVSLPGVPYEMKEIMEKEVIPRLKTRFVFPSIVHRTFLTSGIGESFLAKRIATLEDSLPAHIKLAYLPHFSTVRLRFSASGSDTKKLEQELTQIKDKLYMLAAPYIAADEDKRLQEVIGEELLQLNASVSTAESCTGGMVAHLLTSVPGSSRYFYGSVVAYHNQVKEQVLGVSTADLQAYGAVSKQVVEQMALGVAKLTGSRFAISTSGIAGPDGGSVEKPVGTVWVGVADGEAVFSKDYLLYGNREQVIERATLIGIEMLRKVIKGLPL